MVATPPPLLIIIISLLPPLKRKSSKQQKPNLASTPTLHSERALARLNFPCCNSNDAAPSKVIIRVSMYLIGIKGVNLYLASPEVLVWHLFQ
ncbi:hypothetical protein ACSBR2_017809 [Camellia fascicularis]